MRNDILSVGDVVVIEVPQENREWGYNPCEDGSPAEVVGFSEMCCGRMNNCGLRPGVHTNRHWIDLRLLATGKTLTLGTHCIKGLLDQEEELRRKKLPYEDKKEFLRELPETPFWESDVVRVEGQELVVTRVNYSSLNEKTIHGNPYPAYEVSSSLDGGWNMSYPAESLTLVRRGPVWDIYHGIPVKFESLEQEAKLAHAMGRTREVKNPASGNYGWTKDEVLEAMRGGTVHGFTVGRSPFSGGLYENAIMFDDAELGERVRLRTLQGFGLTASL